MKRNLKICLAGLAWVDGLAERDPSQPNCDGPSQRIVRALLCSAEEPEYVRSGPEPHDDFFGRDGGARSDPAGPAGEVVDAQGFGRIKAGAG
jgi:hypothetical protein